MNDTSVICVSPSSRRKVVGMATTATISGASARNEANTKMSTARAPTPPSSTSTRRLGPDPPPVSPIRYASPVTPTGAPATDDVLAAASIAGAAMGVWSKPGATGP